MHFVRKVELVSGHRLLLTFEDGCLREVDLGPHLDGDVFQPLRALDYFSTVRLEPDLDTIVWDNGADFSPDFLYEIGVQVSLPAHPSR